MKKVNIETFVLEMLCAFPDLENMLANIFGKGIAGLSSAAVSTREARKLLHDYLAIRLSEYKEIILHNPSDVRNLRNAFFDVKIYKTDIEDAVDDWGVDKTILTVMVKYIELGDADHLLVSRELRRMRELDDHNRRELNS